jgi:hypothetical protein
MNTINSHIPGFGIVDEDISKASTHRYRRPRSFAEKKTSVIESTSLQGDESLEDHFRESLQIGLEGARLNRLPTLVALIFMSLMAVAYAYVPSFESSLNEIATLKMKMGPAFAFLGMGLSVGFLSEFMKVRASETRRWSRSNTGNFIFLFLMFGLIAVAQDPVYYLLANLYGDSMSFSTIIRKVLFDQFAWTLLLACPAKALLFAWKAHGFSKKSLSVECPNFTDFFVSKMLPTLITNWSFWVPVSAIIFCFPTELQLAVSIVAVSCWILLSNLLLSNDSVDLSAESAH